MTAQKEKEARKVERKKEREKRKADRKAEKDKKKQLRRERLEALGETSDIEDDETESEASESEEDSSGDEGEAKADRGKGLQQIRQCLPGGYRGDGSSCQGGQLRALRGGAPKR